MSARFCALAFACLLGVALLPSSACGHEGLAGKRPLTVEDSIQMRRLQSFDGRDQGKMLSYSPDGSRYALRVIEDRLAEGGTWVEFLTGRTSDLTAATPLLVGKLFTTAARDGATGTLPPTHPSPNAAGTVLSGLFAGRSPLNNNIPYTINLKSRSSRKIACADPVCRFYGMADSLRFSPDFKYMATSYSEGSDARTWRVLRFDRRKLALTEVWRQPGFASTGSGVIWAPSSERIIIGPIQTGMTAAPRPSTVEFDPTSGRYWLLPVPTSLAGDIRPVRWREDGVVELRAGRRILAFKKTGREWEKLSFNPVEQARPARARVQIEIRQDINTPPVLYANDRITGRERALLNVEPRLSEFSLGRAEVVSFVDSDGTAWEGKLFYPVDYKRGKRYPMVITSSSAVGESWKRVFSLNGNNPFSSSLYAAQALANRDIAVVELSLSGLSGTKPIEEARKITLGFEAAAKHFVANGLAQRDKIGLAGFSRTGYYVEQVITRSDYPFVAAIASDNVDHSYVQAILHWGLGGYNEKVHGALPFGDGLLKWLQGAPGFNVEKIRTPLRIEVVSGGVAGLMMGWEMYAKLHYLKRPVELVLVPEPDGAVHAAQMPVQKLFSQSGTVDWFDFWLNGRENPDPAKAEQYVRWRALRKLQRTQTSARRKSSFKVGD